MYLRCLVSQYRIPYVKEEIVVKKKTVPETRTVTEEIITEKVEDPQV